MSQHEFPTGDKDHVKRFTTLSEINSLLLHSPILLFLNSLSFKHIVEGFLSFASIISKFEICDRMTNPRTSTALGIRLQFSIALAADDSNLKISRN